MAGILTPDMQRVIREQRLGFVATVRPDGGPNLSPKGTLTVWDDDTLAFADLRSPQTIANLRHDPRVEINVVDPVRRAGYRFAGTATVLGEGRHSTRLSRSSAGASGPSRTRAAGSAPSSSWRSPARCA
jgi:hypothetical protein